MINRIHSGWLICFRLGILKEGYIYPKNERPVRDLLRKRVMFVRQRTAQILSLQGMITRNTGARMTVREIKRLRASDAKELFNQNELALMAMCNISTILVFDRKN